MHFTWIHTYIHVGAHTLARSFSSLPMIGPSSPVVIYTSHPSLLGNKLKPSQPIAHLHTHNKHCTSLAPASHQTAVEAVPYSV